VRQLVVLYRYQLNINFRDRKNKERLEMEVEEEKEKLKNKKLREKFREIQNEVNTMKDLMKELGLFKQASKRTSTATKFELIWTKAFWISALEKFWLRYSVSNFKKKNGRFIEVKSFERFSLPSRN